MPRSAKTLVIYLPSMASGGAERLHLHLAPEFLKAGFEVTFLLQKAEGALMPLLPASVRVVSLGKSRTFACLWPLIKFMKREQPDIFLANLGHNNILAIWAAALARVPTRVIASQHNTLSAESGPKAGWQHRMLPLLYRLFLGRADGIVAVSGGVADDLAACTGIARSRITAIYNPVVFANFDDKMNEPVTHPWLTGDGPPVVMGVGRLVGQKDFPTLIAAFALAAKTQDLRLIILGEGPLREALLAQAENLGVKDRVSLPGFAENPLPLMRAASLLVLSSRFEGFGNALVEALACGTPVLSTDCPHGPAEILEDGRFGALVPVGDAEAMARAISETLEKPLDTDVLKARGREFTVARAAGEYVRLFGELSAKLTA